MLPQPPVPASTTAYTNTTGQTAYVTITGGTVTSINVNGTQVATATNFTATVPPGQAIAVTYSAAPSWTWSALTPAVPASGTAVSNPTGQNVSVAITGGTVTHVTVNGTDRATSSPANVMVPAGGSITLTYSSAPVWSWMNYPDFAGNDSLGTNYGDPNNAAAGAWQPETAGPYAQHGEGGQPGMGSGVSN